MTLDEGIIKKWYRIVDISEDDVSLKTRLLSFGLIPGEKIQVLKHAPIFKDPIIIQSDFGQIILGRKEAHLIQIKVEE